MSSYLIKNKCDIADRGVFVKFPFPSESEEVKNLAIYLQFKATEIIDEAIILDSATIAQFLCLQGAEILSNKPNEFCEIDLNFDRSNGFGFKWYVCSFNGYDKNHGEQASEFLLNKAKGAGLTGCVI